MTVPTYSEAVEFSAGCTACADGKLRADNPHPADSAPWSAWQRGWNSEFQRLPQALQAVRLSREPSLVAGQENE